MLETSLSTAIARSLWGVWMTVLGKVTARWSDVTEMSGGTDASRADKIGISISGATKSDWV